QIVARIVVDALFGFLEQFIAITELGGARRADLSAGGGLSGSHPLAAHDALADARDRLVPFVLGHAERAGGHAVAASHAAALVVGDRAEGGLLERAHRADGGAGLVALLAPDAHGRIVKNSLAH